LRAHKWAVLRRGVQRAAIGWPSRYIYHITRERYVRSACVRACVRTCMDARERIRIALAYLEKRTISLSPVVGVGIAFVSMRIRSYIYMRVT